MSQVSPVQTIVWMDIPVVDLQRARQFYASVLDIEVSIEKFEQTEFAVLAHGEVNGACLVVDADKVGAQGPLVYLNVSGRLSRALEQVEVNGGKVVQAVHSIGAHGERALIIDSEGNRFALHSETNQE